MGSQDENKQKLSRPGETETPVSRRSFLRSGAAVGVSGAAALAGARAADAADSKDIKWDREVDVVVIGAGASGLPASIAARDGGASVMLVEQHFDIGGCAIISGGAIHIGAGNRIQQEKGIKDLPDLVFADWTRANHPAARYNDRDLVRKFADEKSGDLRLFDRERPGLGVDRRAAGRFDRAATGHPPRMADPQPARRLRSGAQRLGRGAAAGGQRAAQGRSRSCCSTR